MLYRSIAIAAAAVSAHAAPTEYADLVASDNPILWYRFSEGPGATVAANSGSLGLSHDAALNAVTTGEPSASGDPAASFSWGLASHAISNGDAPASMLGNPTFTAETVVFIPSAGTMTNYPPFLHWGSGGATLREVYFSLHHNTRSRVFVGFYNAGLRGECEIRLDDWNHFVWLRDSAGGTNDAFTGSRLFVNGREVRLEFDTVLLAPPNPPDVLPGPFRVQRATNFYRYFDGLIDEVVLYDTLLTPAKIADRFDALGLNPVDCSADVGGACAVLDIDDVLTFLDAFSNQDAVADFADPIGVFNIDDVLAFLDAFSAGCD